MYTNVYFENDGLVVEKNGKKNTYPVDELRYKESCIYYKRPRGNIIDGSKNTTFLKLYHKNKCIAVLSKKDASFGALIETYNLKIYRESDEENGFIHLEKPGNLIFVHTLCFWGILFLVFLFWLTLIGENGIKYYTKIALLILIVILDIFFYKSSKYKVYYNNEKIELRYTFRKKVYTYEQISEYNIYQSLTNNKMEMINITFEDDKTIIINQEYENYQDFLKILKEKAFTPYVECL